jgi:hypothetical protein
MNSALTLLALPSLAALALVVTHTWLNHGRNRSVSYFLVLSAYGLARGRVIRWVTEDRLGTPFPYLMDRPLLQVAQVSLQEVAGWALAVTLALWLGQRALRLLGRSATPHRTAAAACGVLALLCLAVESAAIAASWWSWTLVVAPHGWLRVPLVALLDWGFVALDFLLPYLLWTTPCGWTSRLVASAFFGLHMLGHTWVQPWPEPFPVAGNDIVHVGLLGYVLARAVRERGPSSPPIVVSERMSWAPPLAAVIVAASSALAHLAAGTPSGAWTSLPLLALAAATWRPQPEPVAPPHSAGVRAWPARTFVVVAGLALLLGLRAPETRRQRAFVERLSQGVAQLNQGALESAESTLREAVSQRPDNAGGRTLLALTLLRRGQRDAAREQIEQALAYQPTARDALLLGIQLDLGDRDLTRAAQRAHLGTRTYPHEPQFAYLESVALGTAGHGHSADLRSLVLARAAGRAELAALANLAHSLGDDATAEACRVTPTGASGS